MNRRYAALASAGALSLLALAACGSPGGGTAKQAGDLNATNVATLGTVVTDAQGHTLYRFDQDTAKPPVSHCYDQCASAWPPVLAGSGTVTIQGLDQSLIRTTTRKDGTQQVTLNGWPLYRYAKDISAGEATGQGVDGTWFAVTPQGGKATATAPAPSSSGDGGGGYGY
jgi:predicted lipoprotein with Yx(FWY)xxD motif